MKNFQSTYFVENLLMASTEPSMILIYFLKFGKSEPCDSYNMYSYIKRVYRQASCPCFYQQLFAEQFLNDVFFFWMTFHQVVGAALRTEVIKYFLKSLIQMKN